MKKNKKAPAKSGGVDAGKLMRKLAREAELARGGRPRAWRAEDGKKAHAKKACRGRVDF